MPTLIGDTGSHCTQDPDRGSPRSVYLAKKRKPCFPVSNILLAYFLKSMDMESLIKDLQTIVKKHWKTILAIALVIWLVANYPDIKSGITDGWNSAR